MIFWHGKLYDVESCTKCGRMYEERREVADASSKFSGQTQMVWVCKCFTLNPMELRESE